MFQRIIKVHPIFFFPHNQKTEAIILMMNQKAGRGGFRYIRKWVMLAKCLGSGGHRAICKTTHTTNKREEERGATQPLQSTQCCGS